MSSLDNSLKVGSNEMELVDFRIHKQVGGKSYEGIYGVNVSKVKEIIRFPILTELPGVPDFVEGIFDLRGVVIPVINLAKWMGVVPPKHINSKNERVIITEFNNILIGFVVHDAKRIRRINWKDIEPATFSSSSADGLDDNKITGITQIEGGSVLLILDLESVVQELGIYSPVVESGQKVEQFKGVVLVVDDSSTARKTVKLAVKKMGLSVREANNGEDGLIKLEELYDLYGDNLSKELRLIISDVEMPKMDGFRFTSLVKDNIKFKDIPIVFNSSISDHFSERRGQDAGGESYLVKFETEAFYKEVARVIHKYEQE